MAAASGARRKVQSVPVKFDTDEYDSDDSDPSPHPYNQSNGLVVPPDAKVSFPGEGESTTSSTAEPEKVQWGGAIEFILTCVGFAVGLGNVWRFPYKCYKNGGGAFLIPCALLWEKFASVHITRYLIMLLLIGMPLFFLEMCVGQFSGQGPISVWKATPLAKGVGYGAVLVSAMIGIYYNVVVAYCLLFLYHSMGYNPVQWAKCGNESWVQPTCRDTSASSEQGATTTANITTLAATTASATATESLSTAAAAASSVSGAAAELSTAGGAASTSPFDAITTVLTTLTGLPTIPTSAIPSSSLASQRTAAIDLSSGAASTSSAAAGASAVTGNLFAAATEEVSGLVSQAGGALSSGGKPTAPSEDFFRYYVLGMNSEIKFTTMQWDIALALFIAWLVVFLVLVKGVQSLGKVVYFSAIFPYIMLTVLLVVCVQLPGASIGIRYYLEPDFSKLTNFEVWTDAAIQIFYSLGVAQAGLITLSSYNKFNNNIFRDALLIPVINCGTSIYAGFIVFSVLGYMAELKANPGEPPSIEDVADDGPGLVFVVYPEALATMDLSWLWSCLFFFMIVNLGFSSQFSIVETLLSAIFDRYPNLRSSTLREISFRGAVCFVCFLLGLIMCTDVRLGGFYIFNMMDDRVAGMPVLFLGLVEIIAFVWIYGFERLKVDISTMLGHDRWGAPYWKIMWQFAVPIVITVILIATLADWRKLQVKIGSLQLQYDWPFEMISWILMLAPIILLVVMFIHEYRQAAVSLETSSPTKIMKVASRPRIDWEPADTELKPVWRQQSLEALDSKGRGLQRIESQPEVARRLQAKKSWERHIESPLVATDQARKQAILEDFKRAQQSGGSGSPKQPAVRQSSYQKNVQSPGQPRANSADIESNGSIGPATPRNTRKSQVAPAVLVTSASNQKLDAENNNVVGSYERQSQFLPPPDVDFQTDL